MKYLKFLIFINFIFGQTYSVGDYVDNFSAEICYNGEGTWEWEVDGFNKVVWISSFRNLVRPLSVGGSGCRINLPAIHR